MESHLKWRFENLFSRKKSFTQFSPNTYLPKVSNLPVTIPTENLEAVSADLAAKLNVGVSELRRLFLVDNMLDTLKFGLSLWCLTYIGSWFNAITLIILAWIGAFSIPKAYLMNQVPVPPPINQLPPTFNSKHYLNLTIFARDKKLRWIYHVKIESNWFLPLILNTYIYVTWFSKTLIVQTLTISLSSIVWNIKWHTTSSCKDIRIRE